jgi:hypothetical protein
MNLIVIISAFLLIFGRFKWKTFKFKPNFVLTF